MRFLPERLKGARKLAGLTQAQLAAELKTDISVVQRWEGGDRQPRGRFVQEFPRILKKPVEFFYEAEEPQLHVKHRQSSVLTMAAPRKPTEARALRESRQRLAKAMEQLSKVQEDLIGTKPETLAAVMRVQRDLLAARDELDKLTDY